MRRTYVLVILDGWGLGEKNESNPIYMARPQAINYIQENFPSGALQASGIAVGLPWEEEGNSEVGHLTIGAGKVLYQHLPRISLSINDGSFFENPALKSAFLHARKNKSSVHLVGLLTDGNVHASFKHLAALLEMAKKENCENLYLQLWSDGRDSSPHSTLNLLRKLDEEMKKFGIGRIASLTGRFWGMDRDGHWDRTEKAYEVLVGKPPRPAKSVEEVLKQARERNINDEFIEPAIINEPHPVQANDALIFFNFREDSVRQITEPFLNKNFNQFPRENLNNLFIATMTAYREESAASVAFPPEKVENPLGKVLSENGKLQLRIAETEKYAHVTYFFNGLKEKPYPNEYRVLVPSKSVAHHDDYPEMMAGAITDRTLAALNEGGFDFILVNYANPDLIAHTGNYEATLKAIKVVDNEVGKLLKSVLNQNHVLIITSDHGNAEELIDLKTGEPETKHDVNPVPFYLIGKEFQKKRPSSIDELSHLPNIGMLSDVAPTILELMDIPKPKDMTGESLLEQLI